MKTKLLAFFLCIAVFVNAQVLTSTTTVTGAESGIYRHSNKRARLGGVLLDSTYINTARKFFGYGNTYAKVITTTNFLGLGINYNGVLKDITPTYKAINGIIDLSAFGDDSSTLYFGGVDLVGGSATNFQIKPTLGNSYLNATNNISLTAINDIYNNANNFTVNTPFSSFNIDSETSLNTNSFYLRTAGGGWSYSDTNNIDNVSVISAFNSSGIYPEGGGIWYRKNKTWDCGYYTLLSPDTTPHAQLFYGVLDSNNNIIDVRRIEVSNKEIHFKNIFSGRGMTLNDTTVSIQSGANFTYFDSTSLKVTAYPNTRNDVDSVAQTENFLFTDNTGTVKSKTISLGMAKLSSGIVTVSDASATTSSKIFFTGNGSTNAGTLRITKGSGAFTISSSNSSDARYVDYLIFY